MLLAEVTETATPFFYRLTPIDQIRALADHYQGLYEEGDERTKKMAYVAPTSLAWS